MDTRGQSGSLTDFLLRRALVAGRWENNVLVRVRDGQIETVTADTPATDGPVHIIEAPVVPGLGNVDSHGFQRGMARLAERSGPAQCHFWSWRELMYRFLERLQPEDVQAITALAYMEMLESGFTQVGEFHYLHRDPAGAHYADPAAMAHAVIAASTDTGIGLTLLPVLYAHGGFGGKPVTPGQRRFELNLDEYARLLELCKAALPASATLGIAPHSLRAVTPAELEALLALHPQGPIHIHAAEQQLEVDDCLAATGQRPVEWLLAHAPIDARWCFVHATQMTPVETAALARSGAVAGLCPITEANLGDGIFPGTAYLEAGGRFAIGTDSNISVSAPQELRAFEYSQRLRDRGRNRLGAHAGQGRSTGRTLLDGALQGGAQVLDSRISAIAAGHRADFVVLDVNHPALLGAACMKDGDQLIDSWVFAASGSAVKEVWVRGRRVVTDGRHVQRTAIVETWQKCAALLLVDG